MTTHVCSPPPRDGHTTWFSCPECRSAWALNPIVLQWFRDFARKGT